jgi:nucleoside-diphosphate-sugar epimerase
MHILLTGSSGKPDMARHPPQDFIDVNATGTLNLLEAPKAPAPCRQMIFETARE